jgi:hypothetical protein
MVAVLILGLTLTAIFSGEGGAIRAAHRARMTEVATLLVRCKMGEIEETVAEEGFPAIEAHDVDGCCEGGEVPGFECEWKVERIVLPELGEEGFETPEGEEGADGEEGATPSIEDLLAGGGADSSGFAGIALSYAFPVMKPQIEEQVRRATVTVRWKEGTRERSFDVVQFLVAEPPPAAPDGEGI